RQDGRPVTRQDCIAFDRALALGDGLGVLVTTAESVRRERRQLRIAQRLEDILRAERQAVRGNGYRELVQQLRALGQWCGNNRRQQDERDAQYRSTRLEPFLDVGSRHHFRRRRFARRERRRHRIAAGKPHRDGKRRRGTTSRILVQTAPDDLVDAVIEVFDLV